jgi:hypothetical protein
MVRDILKKKFTPIALTTDSSKIYFVRDLCQIPIPTNPRFNDPSIGPILKDLTQKDFVWIVTAHPFNFSMLGIASDKVIVNLTTKDTNSKNIIHSIHKDQILDYNDERLKCLETVKNISNVKNFIKKERFLQLSDILEIIGKIPMSKNKPEKSSDSLKSDKLKDFINIIFADERPF